MPFFERSFKNCLLLLLYYYLSLLSPARRGIKNSSPFLPSQRGNRCLTWLQNATASPQGNGGNHQSCCGSWLKLNPSSAHGRGKIVLLSPQSSTKGSRPTECLSLQSKEAKPFEVSPSIWAGLTRDRKKIQCKASLKHNQLLGLLLQKKKRCYDWTIKTSGYNLAVVCIWAGDTLKTNIFSSFVMEVKNSKVHILDFCISERNKGLSGRNGPLKIRGF